MARLRPHLLSGTITDNPLLVGATTINSAGFASLPVVTTDTIDLVLDPDSVVGAPEIVRVTAHTSSSTTVTVTRAADTTGGAGAARQHNTGEKWVLAALTPDFTHANLASLSADDHTQYHTDARHAAIVHLIGTEMNAPGTPAMVGLAGSAGSSNNPAREDHVHQLGSTVTDGVTIHLQVATNALELKDGGITQAKFSSGYRATYEGSSAPSSPSAGDLWWDTTNKLEKVYDGTEWIQLTADGAHVDANESTGSTTFTDLTTVGPSVTLLTGSRVLVTMTAQMENATGGAAAIVGVAVSGATTLAASATQSVADAPGTSVVTRSGTFLLTGLTPGVNTFTMKYEASAGTAFFQRRNIMVTPLTN